MKVSLPAEAPMPESEIEYRTLLEQVPVIIYAARLDEIGSTFYVSKRIEQLGFSQAEWLEDPALWSKQLHPDDRERVLAEYTRAHTEGEPFRSEYRLLARDGRVVWFRDESVIVRDSTGQPLYVQGVMMDITERKQNWEILQRQALLLDQSYDAVFAWEPDGKIVYWNRGAERLYGIPSSEAIGRIPCELLQTVFPESLQHCKETLERTGFWEGELEHQVEDGRRILVESRMTFVRGSGGNLVLEANRDITKHKRAEEAPTENLARLSKKHRYEEIISSVTRSVHQSISIKDVLENTVESLSKNMPAVDHISVFLVEGEEAVLMAHKGFPDRFIEKLRRIPYPKGFTWETIIKGETIYCADTDKDTLMGPAGGQLGTKSYLSLPIRFEGKTVGTININSLKKHAFDEEEIKLMDIVRQQIEVALNNAKQAEALRQSLARLSKKNRYENIVRIVTQSVHRSINLQDVLENAVQAMSENIERADNVAIYLVEGEDSGELSQAKAVMRATRGSPDWFIERAGRIPYPRGFTWKTIMEGEPRYCPDTDKDEFLGPAGRELGIKSYLSLPIGFKEKTIGSININSFTRHAFEKEELELIETVRQQIEIAIKNAKQAEALRDSEEKLRLFIRNAPSAIAMFDRDMRYLAFSRRWLTDYNLGEQDLTSRSHYEVFPDLPERWKEVHRRCLAGAVEKCEEEPFPRVDGSVDWVRWEVHPWQTSEGNIGGIIIFAEVITERKRAEESLRESEERLRLALDAANMGTFDWDMVSGRIVWSSGHERLFGFAPGTFGGTYREFEERVHPDDLPRVNREVARCIAEKAIFNQEFRVIWPDSSIHWVAGTGQFTFDGSGKPVRMCGVVMETTERKRMEERILREKDFSEAMINSLPGIFYLYDDTKKFLRWNKNFEHVSGYSAEEIAGMSPLDFFVGEEKKLIEEGIQEVFVKGESSAEADFVSKDGRRIPYYFTGLRITIDNKPCLIGTGIDITERKRAEEAIRESEKLLRKVIDGLGPYMFVGLLTPDGTLIEANRPALQIAGLKPEEVLGRSLEETYWLSYSEPVKQRLREAMHRAARGEICRYDEVIRAGENRFLTIDFCLRPMYDDTGRIIYLIPSAVDITDRKRAEEALHHAYDEMEQRVIERTRELTEANIKLKELDRLKAEFLATMSHELRTPLNSIIGFTGMILQGMAGEINEEQKKQLSMVYNSAKHLLSLINDILDLSRIESGKVEVSVKKFKVDEVVSEVVRSLDPMVSQKGLRLVTEVPDEIPEIWSDRQKFFQILLNLVNNAVKFTDKGEVRIACKTDHDNLEVSVSDTGIGIKKENLNLLFEAFRQVDGTSRRRYEGTGLGLYLCKKLLDLLGGRIWVESEYGKGSRFTFTIPLESREGG